MKINYEVRYASHPEDAKAYDTTRLRKEFLIQNMMVADEINMVYTMYDRLIVGGAVPVKEKLELSAIDPLRAPFFCGGGNWELSMWAEPGLLRWTARRSNWIIKRRCIWGKATGMCSFPARIAVSRLISILIRLLRMPLTLTVR